MASFATISQQFSDLFSRSDNKQLPSPSLRQLNDSVYEFYTPPDGMSVSVEIIFFHGVEHGDYSKAYVETWTSFLESTVVCWPQTLLAEQFRTARILSVSYDSSIEKRPRQGKLDLYLTAENLVHDLIDDSKVAANPGLPVILVGKDFGGLVIKAICMKAKEQNRFTFLSNLRGIFYYGTPHLGVENLPAAFNGALAERLMFGNNEIARLGWEFSKYRQERKWATRAILSLHTSEKVPELVISEASQRSDVDHYYTPNEGIDTVCKAQARTSSSFKFLTDLISRIESGELMVESSREQGLTEGVEFKTSLGFGHDGNYVPMEKTLAEVKNALQDSHIVVLHGGPGSGKSSFARYLALQFEAAAKQEGTGVARTCSGEQSYWLPNGVVHITCGDGAEITSMQRELLQKFNIEVPLLQDKSMALEGPAEVQRMLRQMLVEHLSKLQSRVVVILDDVWDRDLLENLLVPGDGVRYLLTTQISTLWNAHDSKRVQMQDVTEEDARHILGNYANFKGGVISKDLKNLGNEIIAATGSHPLALATLGIVLDNMGRTVKDWQQVKGNLKEHLETKDYPPSSFGQNYPLSVDVSMMVVLDLLEEDAKKLLYIISLFDGPFILETLLQLFLMYALPKDDKINFSKSIMSLVAKGLVRIETETFGDRVTNLTTSNKRDDMRVIWIHSLRQHFILTTKTKEICQITDFLDNGWDHKFLDLEERSNLDLAIALCALYGSMDIKKRALKKMGSDFIQTHSHELAPRLKPFVSLMLHEADTKNPISRAAIEVFHKYVCKRELDDDNISQLLKLTTYPSVPLATLRALALILRIEFHSIEQVKLIHEDHVGFVSGIVSFLDSRVNAHGRIQEETTSETAQIRLHACVVLLNICVKARSEKSTTVVRNVPHVLTVLVDLIQAALQAEPGKESNQLAAFAARALVELSDSASEDAVLKICKTEGLLAGLVGSLSAHYNPKLQTSAAGALRNLAAGEADTRLKICNAQGALAGLIKCLAAHDNHALQESAATALAILASGDVATKLKICDEEGALSGLVQSLSEHDSCRLQCWAARALANLAFGDVATKLKICNEAGVLSGLVQSLSEHDNPRLQEWAALALHMLAKDVASARKICDEPGSRVALVQSLSALTNPALQCEAAQALADLAHWRGDIRLKICQEEGVLCGLVKLLFQEENTDVQEAGATALANLAFKGETVKLKVANEKGAIEGLVRAMSQHEKPRLQKRAISALNNLANTADKSIKLKIAEEEGVLCGLVKLLFQEENTDVQEAGAAVLAILAFTNDTFKLKVANEKGAIDGLVRAMSQHDKPGLQKRAIKALSNLSSTADESIKLKIAEEEGVLCGLVKLLFQEENTDVQEAGATALANLAFKDETVKLKVANEKGAIEGLVRAMSQHDKPGLQKGAIKALSNLANTADESIKLKIAEEEGVLCGLVKLLFQEENTDVQEAGATALANLAFKDQTVTLKVANEKGAIEGLVRAMSQHDKPGLQKWAIKALGDLVYTADESIKLKIAEEEGVLCGLVKLLFQEENTDVQEAGATALANLAFKGETVKRKVANEKGAIEGLVRAMSQHDKPVLQERAIKALTHLADTADESIKLKIAEEEGAAACLVKLSTHENPEVRELATRLMVTLGLGGSKRRWMKHRFLRVIGS